MLRDPAPVVALNRSSKSQIAARYAAFWHAVSQIALPLSLSDPKSQRFKSQRLQDANSTKSQTLAFYKSQRFNATKSPTIYVWKSPYGIFLFVFL